MHSNCGIVLMRKQWYDHSRKRLCIRMYQNCPVRNIQMMHWTVLEKGNEGNGQFHVISFLAVFSFSLFIATLWFSQAGTESANTFSLLQALLGLRLHSKASPSARDLWYTQSPNTADLNSHTSSNFMVGNVPPVDSQTAHGKFTDPDCSCACGAVALSAPRRKGFSILEFKFKPRKSS